MKIFFEKRRGINLETHLAFIDYEKAFDRLNRATIWDTVCKRGYPKHLVDRGRFMHMQSRQWQQTLRSDNFCKGEI